MLELCLGVRAGLRNLVPAFLTFSPCSEDNGPAHVFGSFLNLDASLRWRPVPQAKVCRVSENRACMVILATGVHPCICVYGPGTAVWIQDDLRLVGSCGAANRNCAYTRVTDPSLAFNVAICTCTCPLRPQLLSLANA